MRLVNGILTGGGLINSSPLGGQSPFAGLGDLYGAGDAGDWWDFNDDSTVFQDAAGTVPATKLSGDPIGAIFGQRGSLNWLQATAGQRLVYGGTFPSGTGLGLWDGVSSRLTATPGLIGQATLGFSVLMPATITGNINRRLLSTKGTTNFSLGFNASSGTSGLEIWAGAAWATLVPFADFASNEYYSIVLTCLGAGTTTAYLNGVQKNTAGGNLYLGSELNWGGILEESYGEYWNRAFRSMFMIDRILTASEIEAASAAMLADLP